MLSETPTLPPAAKPRTCENCVCWRKIGSSPVARNIMYDTGVVQIPPGAEGQCRLTSPREDFKWPLTKAGDWCGGYRAAQAPKKGAYVQDSAEDGLTTGAKARRS